MTAIGVVRFALPVAMRWAAAGRLTALTGLTTTIADVDVSLLDRSVVAHDVAVGAAEGESRLASIPRVDVALRLPPLLRGRVSLELTAQGTLQLEPLAVDVEVDAREISLALAVLSSVGLVFSHGLPGPPVGRAPDRLAGCRSPIESASASTLETAITTNAGS